MANLGRFEDFDKLFGDIDQIGIVVDDLERIKSNMRRLFGAEARDSGITKHPGAIYRGEPVTTGVHILFYDMFNIELEFLMPTEGRSIWQDWVDEHGSGLHHIRFNVASHDEAVKYMEDHGVKVYQQADSMRGGGIKFAYFDTFDEVGFCIETLNLREIGEA